MKSTRQYLNNKVIIIIATLLLSNLISLFFIFNTKITTTSVEEFITIISIINILINTALTLIVFSIIFYIIDFIFSPSKRSTASKLLFIVDSTIGLIIYLILKQLVKNISTIISSVASSDWLSIKNEMHYFDSLDLNIINWLTALYVIYSFILIVIIVVSFLSLKNKKEYFIQPKKVITKIKLFPKKATLSTVIITCIAGGLILLQNNFKQPTLDIFEGVNIEFSGISTKGKATVDSSQITISENEKINEFIESIDFELDKNTLLSNGDIIKMTAKPNIELMKKYNIKVTSLVKEYTVTGLYEIPISINDIDNLESINSKIEDEIKKRINSNLKNDKTEVTSKNMCYSNNVKNTSLYPELKYGTYLKIFEIIDIAKLSNSDKYISLKKYKAVGYTNITSYNNKIIEDNIISFSLYTQDTLNEMIKEVESLGLKCK